METNKLSDRPIEDVKAAAKIAGISVTNGPVQLLHFSDSPNDTDNIKLLQLTNEITTALETGQRVVIKGQENDDAVLCTDDSTYELRVCETSNSLLLCPDLVYPGSSTDYGSDSIVNKEVIGRVPNILEVKRCRPKLERLKQLLSQAPYKGPLEERLTEEAELSEDAESSDQHNTKYTFSDLLALVQASQSEITEGLKNQQACLINGYWRVFDVDYRDELVQHILTLLEEQDWSWRHIPLDACCDKLSELHPPFAIKHCLECYGTPLTATGLEEDTDTCLVYELSEDKVCRFFVEVLLRPAGRFNYHEFMESWQQTVPDGMTTNLTQLKGLALCDLNSLPPVIWFFPEQNLPREPSERFAKLFSVREKWSYEDLEPYIKSLVTPLVTMNSLLLKYTRVSVGANRIKLYNSKMTAF